MFSLPQHISVCSKVLISFWKVRLAKLNRNGKLYSAFNTNYKDKSTGHQTGLSKSRKLPQIIFAYISGLSGGLIHQILVFRGKIGKKPVQDYHRSVLDCHRSVLDCHSSVLYCHSSVLYYHSSVLDCHSSVLDCHSSVLDCHSSVLDYHGSVLDCHGSVLDCRSTVLDCCNPEHEFPYPEQVIFIPEQKHHIANYENYSLYLNGHFNKKEEALIRPAKGLFIQEYHYLTLYNCFTRFSSLFWNFTKAGPENRGELYPLYFSQKN